MTLYGHGVVYIRKSLFLSFLPVCRTELLPAEAQTHLSFRHKKRASPVRDSQNDLAHMKEMISRTLGSSFTIQPFSYIGSDATVQIGKWDDEAHIALMCAAAECGANIERKRYISFALLASKRLMNTVRELSTQ